MKPELEKQVMIALYKVDIQHEGKWLRLRDIAKVSGIPMPNLQRVIPRLVGRGWIRKETRTDPDFPGVFHLGNYGILDGRLVLIKEVAERFNSTVNTMVDAHQIDGIEGRRYTQERLLEAAFRSITPRSHVYYQLTTFPYIDDSIFQYGRRVLMPLESEDRGVPEGKKRFWRNAAKELLAAIPS